MLFKKNIFLHYSGTQTLKGYPMYKQHGSSSDKEMVDDDGSPRARRLRRQLPIRSRENHPPNRTSPKHMRDCNNHNSSRELRVRPHRLRDRELSERPNRDLRELRERPDRERGLRERSDRDRELRERPDRDRELRSRPQLRERAHRDLRDRNDRDIDLRALKERQDRDREKDLKDEKSDTKDKSDIKTTNEDKELR